MVAQRASSGSWPVCLTRHIADVSMGTVHEAEHVQSQAQVAIKALNPEFSQNPEPIDDVLGGDPNGSRFIVMELLRGKNLADTLAGHAQGMPFAPNGASVEQLSAALTAIVGATGSHPQPVPLAPRQALAGGAGRLWAMIVLGVLLGGGGGAAAVAGLASQGPEQPVFRPQLASYTSDLKSDVIVTAPPKPPVAKNGATLTFKITPSEAAEIAVIRWDGEVVDGDSIKARVGSKSHKVHIKAKGYSRISRRKIKVSKSTTLSFELKPRKKTCPSCDLEL